MDSAAVEWVHTTVARRRRQRRSERRCYVCCRCRCCRPISAADSDAAEAKLNATTVAHALVSARARELPVARRADSSEQLSFCLHCVPPLRCNFDFAEPGEAKQRV